MRSHRPESTASIPNVQWQQPPSLTSRDEGSQAALNEKTSVDAQASTEAAATTTAGASRRSWWSWRLQPRPPTASDSSDPEKGGKRPERKLVLIGPIYAGCGAALAVCGYTFYSSLPCNFAINFFLQILSGTFAQWLTFLCLDFVMSGLSVLLGEFALDGSFTRFALLAVTPVIFCVSIVRLLLSHASHEMAYALTQFFCLQLVGNICLM